MNWSSTSLTTFSSDTEPSIIVDFLNAKFVFNVGESTSRSLSQTRRNWKRTRAVFLTQINTRNASGLTGALMSLADSNSDKMKVFGPPGLVHWLASMRFFTYRNTFSVLPTDLPLAFEADKDIEPIYKDDNATVYSFPVLASGPLVKEDDLSGKRKLDDVSSSSPISPKRRIVEDESGSPSILRESSMASYPSIEEALKDSNFCPSSLSGELSEQWRKKMINIMFPGTYSAADKNQAKQRHNRQLRGEPEPKGKKGKQNGKNGNGGKQSNGKGERSVIESEDVKGFRNPMDEFRRIRPPPQYSLQLPVFEAPTGNEPSTQPSMGYIVVGPRIRGKFDAAKAEELKIPKHSRNKLTGGQTVTYKVTEGNNTFERTVRPEEVIGESIPPSVLIVIDVPTIEHIPSLTTTFSNSTFFSRFRTKETDVLKERVVRTVHHFCGPGVLDDPRYQEFMNGFGDDADHIVASREYNNDPVTYTSAGYNQLRLHQLDPTMFPIPHHDLIPLKDFSPLLPKLPKSSHLMVPNLITSMRPPVAPHPDPLFEVVDRFHPNVDVAKEGKLELSKTSEESFIVAREKVVEMVQKGAVPASLPGSDVKITTLGTGSAVPSKYRNVLSNLIQIPGHGNILLDCGEGTWGQLVRSFGTDTYQVLRDIKCIFASHIHADHHLGLAKVLSKRRQLDPPPSEPLYLVTIRRVHLYLRELSNIESLGFDEPNGIIPIMSEALHWKQRSEYMTDTMWAVENNEPWTDINLSRKTVCKMCKSLGLNSFITADVMHRTPAYGCIISHKDNWSIVFSGDTIPCESLAIAGAGTTVLIHEATLDDGQEAMASSKSHSTFGQAIQMGKVMKAKHVLLTHFSARYPKLPPGILTGPTEGTLPDPIVALAFDGASLRIGDMWKMNYYLNAGEKSFGETVEEGDEEEEKKVRNMDVK